MSARRTVKVGVDEIAVPDIAWPTVLVCFTAGFLYFIVFRAAIMGDLSPIISIPLQAIFSFVLFTPMHDASHSSISKKYRWLNGLIGRFCALFFMAPFPAFRWAHLQHHHYTNDPEKDPDFWSGSGPVFLRPLRWLSQDLHYYVPYVKNASTRPKAEVIEALVLVILSWTTIFALLLSGYAQQTFLYFLLPKAITTMMLAYAFDYVPHHPHQARLHDNPYKTTSKINGLFSISECLDLSVPLLNQNLHNIHHLYSQVPFYRYHKIWNNHEKEFTEAGTPYTTLF